jgi:hypothetical protein
MLDADDTALVLHPMRNVVPSEQWGFADVVAKSLEPAIKNGWYEDTDAPVWRIHCTAIFNTPGLKHNFSIAVFTRYAATLGMGYAKTPAAASPNASAAGSPKTSLVLHRCRMRHRCSTRAGRRRAGLRAAAGGAAGGAGVAGAGALHDVAADVADDDFT